MRGASSSARLAEPMLHDDAEHDALVLRARPSWAELAQVQQRRLDGGLHGAPAVLRPRLAHLIARSRGRARGSEDGAGSP